MEELTVPVAPDDSMLHDLCEFCAKGDLNAVQSLINEHIELTNCRDTMGWTPVAHAAAGGHAKIVRLLIDKGADVSISVPLPPGSMIGIRMEWERSKARAREVSSEVCSSG